MYNIIYLKELSLILKNTSPFTKLKQYYMKYKNNKNKSINEALYNAGKIISKSKSNNYNSLINNRIKKIYITNDSSSLDVFYESIIKL